MPLTVEWTDIALRLVLTIAAGAVLGINRTERGRAAGLRTTLLVTLAASVSMIQMNLLLVSSGKNSSSFSVMDVMRLPLGILTGMGFIGAGVILRRGDRIQGVTTAATLWTASVLGLCFGGGQLLLGGLGVAVSVAILSGLRCVEARLARERRGKLRVRSTLDGPSEVDIRAKLLAEGFSVTRVTMDQKLSQEVECRTISWELSWYGHPLEIRTPAVLGELLQRREVLEAKWQA